ncbi:MAG: glycosyltransferase [Eubacterium sp.]|nr:glycosyltransferase [Eubacterium sp.]
MKCKRISVIVINYRGEESKFILCIKSILDQEYQDFEVLIVDDGSPEDYREKVYSNPIFSDERIKIHYQENGGISAARNTGIRLAEGEYVTIVDSDDLITSPFLKEGMRVAEKYCADMIFGCVMNSPYVNEIKQEERLVVRRCSEDDTSYVKSLLLGKHYFIKNSHAHISRGTHAKIFRRDIVKQKEFDTKLTIYEDTAWFMDVVGKAKTICLVDSVWYVYTIALESASKGLHKDEIDRSTRGMKEVFDRIDITDQRIKTAFVEQCILEYSRILDNYYLNKKNKMSNKEKKIISKKQIESHPWNIIKSMHALKGLDFKLKVRGELLKHNLWLPLKLMKNRLKRS